MNFAKLPLPLALGLAILLTLGATAQTTPPASTNTVATERFLVIVETSAAMQKRATNVYRVLGSVIASGLNGNMASGSTVGMWTFNNKLSTGQLPLQLWTPATRQRVASTMVQFLQLQKNEKSPRLTPVWEAATNIIAQSERITVLLITSGNDLLVGTPFDAAINESLLKNSDQQRQSNMPFLTILRAVQGKFVAFAVNTPPWPLEVPEYPDGFKPAPPPPPVKVVSNAAPPVVKRPNPAILSPTNTIYLTEPSTPVAAPTNPVVAAPQLPPPPTNAPGSVPEVVNPKATPESPVIAAVETGSPLATSAPVAKKKFSIVVILGVGLAVLLAVLLGLLGLLRWSRRSSGASLITRSMHNDPK